MSFAWSLTTKHPTEEGNFTDSGIEPSFSIIYTPTSSSGGDMPLTTIRRMADGSPTKASTRATTRNGMLNTISDRVQHSQEQRQAFDQGEPLRYERTTGSPSHKTQLSGELAENGSLLANKTMRPLPNLRYDIATLIQLGKKALDSSEVLLKVKPEAIAENLFQYMGIDRSLRPTARSRGLSDISNLSCRSMISSSGITEWEPSRQPRAAPRDSDSLLTSRLQQHEGFVRFLKQHASPPHQRVTAGGRIVPTGPLSPPPMFDYASLNGLVQGQQVKTQEPTGSRVNTSNNHTSGLHRPTSHSTIPASYLAAQNGQSLGAQMISSGMAQGALNYGNMSYAQQPFMSSMVQSPLPPFALTPLGAFSDGTALISCNGICYRSYWNGVTTIMDPITTGQPISMASDAAINYPPTLLAASSYGVESYGATVSSLGSQSTSLPSTVVPALPSIHKSHPIDSTRDSTPPSEEIILKTQLTNLDKHLALHHYEIGPAEKAQLVSRRKLLVEAIAKLRNDRDPTKQVIPIVAKSRDGSRKSSTQIEMHTRNIPSTRQPEQDTPLDTPRDMSSNEITSFKKCLSPSAPAFVPKSLRQSFPGGLALGPMPKKSAAVTMTKPPTLDSMKTSNSLDEAATGEDRLREVSASSESQPYVEVDPWDPAMKIVPPSMIEYAQKYTSGSTRDVKKFCTTVEEFQEAIRRVREQARMWGCVGGNSKDPAYDAEEDIWYAIKDEYPIPLPTEIPDHITCPRPWNWYDSAFNVKATIEPRINMRGDTFDDIYLHPKKEATSARYTFADILPPTKRELEAAKEASVMPTATPALGLDTMLRDGMPFRMQIRDTSLDQKQNQQQKVSPTQLCGTSENLSSHVNGLRAPSTVKAAANMHTSPPKHSTYTSVQKRNDTFPSQVRTDSSVRQAALHDAMRVRDEIMQRRSTIDQGRVPPSPTSLSAAQAAYSAKTPASSRLFQVEIESCPETPSMTRNETHSNSSVGIQVVEGSTHPNDRLRNQDHNAPTGSILPRTASQKPVSPMTGKNEYRAAYQHPNPNSISSKGMTHFSPDDSTSNHREDCACSSCRPYELGDPRLYSPRSGDTRLGSGFECSLSAESKRAWGPEQLFATTRNDLVPTVKIPRSMTNGEARYRQDCLNHSYGDRHLPRFASNAPAPSAHEVKLENVVGIPDLNSDTFLKDMLKNPRYSFTFQHNDGTPMEPLMAYQIAQNQRGIKFSEELKAGEEHVQQVPEKENTNSARGTARNNSSTTTMLGKHPAIARGSGSRLLAIAPNSPNSSVSKASSSLASSAYHAQGYLPPYDGAGKARAASIYQQQPYHAPHHKPRVHLPLSSSYVQQEYSDDRSDQQAFHDQAAYNGNARYIPTSLGYDGSEDPPPDDDTANGKAKAKAKGNPSLDYKGVTTADFDQHRPNHDNEWHRGAVNDFFRDLHEKEVKNMMARQRKNTKTIP